MREETACLNISDGGALRSLTSQSDIRNCRYYFLLQLVEFIHLQLCTAASKTGIIVDPRRLFLRREDCVFRYNEVLF